MKEFDPKQFEAELQTLRPIRPTQQSLQRIRAQLNAGAMPVVVPRPRRSRGTTWISFLRWLAPAAGAAAIIALLLHLHHVTGIISTPSQLAVSSAAPAPVLKADKVEIDRQLVADFDAVTQLPGGQPVRFRCEQWLDKVSLRDSSTGLMIERTTPRLEIVPVRFETY